MLFRRVPGFGGTQSDSYEITPRILNLKQSRCRMILSMTYRGSRNTSTICLPTTPHIKSLQVSAEVLEVGSGLRLLRFGVSFRKGGGLSLRYSLNEHAA